MIISLFSSFFFNHGVEFRHSICNVSKIGRKVGSVVSQPTKALFSFSFLSILYSASRCIPHIAVYAREPVKTLRSPFFFEFQRLFVERRNSTPTIKILNIDSHSRFFSLNPLCLQSHLNKIFLFLQYYCRCHSLQEDETNIFHKMLI